MTPEPVSKDDKLAHDQDTDLGTTHMHMHGCSKQSVPVCLLESQHMRH